MVGDVTASGRELHQGFLALGDLTGKTLDEIIAAVGPPSSYSAMAGGQTLVQWQATGCHMALMFGPDGKFLGITHQFAQYAAAPQGCLTTMIALILVLLTVAVIVIR